MGQSLYTPEGMGLGGVQNSFWHVPDNADVECNDDPIIHATIEPQFTTEWKYYEAKSSIPAEGNGMKSIASTST